MINQDTPSVYVSSLVYQSLFLYCRWTYFYRSMFWLAVIGGGLMVLHAFLLIILKFVKRNSEKHRIYGALIFPRFEIFLIFLALPGICKASAVLIKGII